jgi:hypothetical protein
MPLLSVGTKLGPYQIPATGHDGIEEMALC